MPGLTSGNFSMANIPNTLHDVRQLAEEKNGTGKEP
jgi:hypothetical protein